MKMFAKMCLVVVFLAATAFTCFSQAEHASAQTGLVSANDFPWVTVLSSYTPPLFYGVKPSKYVAAPDFPQNVMSEAYTPPLYYALHEKPAAFVRAADFPWSTVRENYTPPLYYASSGGYAIRLASVE